MAQTAAILDILVRANTASASAGLTRLDGQMRGTASRADVYGRRIATGIKYGALAAGVAGAASVKMAVDFDRSMRNVNSIAQLPEKQLDRLGDRVKDLAGKTAQAPLTISEGLYDLVSSGFDANESMKVLTASAKGATAGLTDTATSTKAVAAVLNAYRQPASKASKVTDTLFRTVDRGVISFEDLASTIGDVLPFASSLGVKLSEVGAATATMTKAGISPSETMTRLKAIMSSLLKPSEDLAATISDIGYDSGEAMIKALGLQGTLEALSKATGGSKAEMAALFPNIRALGGALALTGDNAGAAEKDLRMLADASGATDRALSEQSKSIAYRWNKLQAQAKSLAIDFGEELLPAIGDVIDILTNPKLTLDEKIAKLGTKLADVVKEWGPKVAKAGANLGISILKGIAQAWWDSDILSKLFIGATFIRLIGGPGALAKLGAALGAPIGASMGTAIGSSTIPTGAAASFGTRFGGLAGPFAAAAIMSAIAGVQVGQSGIVQRAATKLTDGTKWMLEHLDDLSHKQLVNMVKAAEGSGHAITEEMVRAWRKSGEVSEDGAKRINAALRSIHPDEVSFKKLIGGLEGVGDKAKKTRRDLRDYWKELSDDLSDANDAGRKHETVLGAALGGISTVLKHSGGDLNDYYRDLAQSFDRSKDKSRSLRQGVGGNVTSLSVIVGDAFGTIGENTNNILGSLGAKRINFIVKSMKSGKGAPGTFATGGVVVPGSGSGDKVPLHVGGQLAAMVEPGEYVSVANRNATKALMATNAAVPRFASGGVIQQALGPYDMPPIAYDPNHAGGNSHLHLDFFTKQQALAYGHRMQGMGWTIGEYSGSNPYGFGPVTVQHQSPGHYDGTAFDANTAADETRAEVAAVVRMLGGAAVGGAAQKIARLILKGPDGPMKNMGQAAIDKATKAANAYIAKHMPTDTGVGYISGGDGAVAVQIGRILTRQGFNRPGAAGIIGNAYAESSWNPAAMEPGTDNGGLWGFTSGEKSLAGLRAYAARLHKPWTDVGAQTAYMLGTVTGDLKAGLNALSSPEAAAGLFMEVWERPGIQRLDVRQQGARMAFGMKGWQRGGIVAKLAEGGLLTPATLSAMAKPSTPGAYPLPGGGEITGGPAVDGISESIMSLLGSTARDKGENPNSYDHGVTRIKDYIDSLGLKKGMLDGLKDKAAQIALLGENADSASSLGGAVGGKSQVEWLKDQLEAMFEYRWMLIKVEAAAKGRAREVAKFVRKLEHEIARMEKIVKRNQDREQDFKDAVKKAKGKDEKEAAEGRLKAFQAMLGGQQAKLGLLKGVVLPGANRKLAGLRGQLDVEGDGAAAALQTLQGIGATKKKLRFTEPFGAELGLLKGDILNTQITLRDALTAGTDDGRDSAVADLLRQQLAASQRDNALLRAQMPVFQSMVPYMGAFAAGGVALVGENGPELASLPSGTRVTSAADTRSMLEPEVALILNGCTIDTHGQTLQEAVKVAVNGELREIGRINERRTPTKV